MKEVALQFNKLREEWLWLYRYKQSCSLRTKRQIEQDIKSLLANMGFNNGEIRAVLNEFLQEGRVLEEEEEEG